MDQTQWGPVTWRLMHGLAERYVPELHHAYRGLYYSLAACLPCAKCRNNYVLHLVALPFPCTRSRLVVRNWVIDMHNMVNRSLRKPQFPRELALKQNKTLNVTHIEQVLMFMDLNYANQPPEQYAAGHRIFARYLGEILVALYSSSSI